MRLSRKNVVQKTVRIDEKIADDLELLSDVLNRSQNDLLNTALANLFKENKLWFKYGILVDGLWDFLANGAESSEYSIGGITVKVHSIDDYTIKLEYELKNKQGELCDKCEYSFTDSEDLQTKLIELAEYVDTDLPEVKKYLEQKTNYD